MYVPAMQPLLSVIILYVDIIADNEDETIKTAPHQ